MEDHAVAENKADDNKGGNINTSTVPNDVDKNDEPRENDNNIDDNVTSKGSTAIKDDNSKDLGGQLSYTCNTCGKSYTQKHNLLRHVTYSCQKEPQFACTKCDHRFVYKHGLIRHMQGHGAEEKKAPNTKDKEDKVSTAEEVNKDDERSENDNSFDESVVSKNSSTPKDDASKDAETPEIFTCSTCGRSYKKKYTLTRHIRHSGCKLLQENVEHMETDDYESDDEKAENDCEKDQEDDDEDEASTDSTQKLSCHKCNGAYTSRQYFLRHLKECGTTMKCIYCNRSFKHKNAYENHLLTCNIKKYLV